MLGRLECTLIGSSWCFLLAVLAALSHAGTDVLVNSIGQWPESILTIKDFTNNTQGRLVQSLLANYSSKIRPVRNHFESVKVLIKLSPYQILDVDEVNQCITMSVWMSEIWFDEFLFWDPQNFDNISEIHLPTEDVWRPDTYLYNNLEMDKDAVQRLINVVVASFDSKRKGQLTMQYPAIYRTSCTMDITNFPFDTQHCVIKFGSWTYDNHGIDYYAAQSNVTLQYFVNNEEWIVLKFTSNRLVTLYACCPNPYTTINYHVWIQRRPLFYTINLVVPSVIVAFINFIGFFTPTSSSGEREEKVTLGITTLLAMGVLLLQLTDHTPHSSTSVPLIGKFILQLIILVGVGTVMTCIIIHLHHRGILGHRPTPALRAFLYCTCFLLSSRNRSRLRRPSDCPKPRRQDKDDPFGAVSGLLHPSSTDDETVLSGVDCTLNHSASMAARLANFELASTRLHQFEAGRSGADCLGEQLPAMVAELNKIRLLIQRCIQSSLSDSERAKEVELEWIMAATALERLCLILFTAATTLMTLLFFLVGSELQAADLMTAMSYNYSLDT